METKGRFYPLLQELSYIRPLTFASAGAFNKGIDSDPTLHNSCKSGDFGKKWADLENDVTCLGLTGPYGTGPFKLLSKETDDNLGADVSTVFGRHEKYWNGAPEIEFLHLKYYANTDDVKADLIDNKLDMALGIGPLTAKQVQDLKFSHSSVVDVRHSDVLQHALMVMNTGAEHTNDINIRQAIIHAIDKRVFIEEEFAGLEKPVSQLLPYSAPYCDVDLSPAWGYDFEKAELLNCPTKNGLGAGGITGISIGAVVVVGLLGLLVRMYTREKQGKPMFAPTKEVEIN